MFTKYRLCAKTFIIVLVNLQYHPSSLIPYSKLLEIVKAGYWTQLPDIEDCVDFTIMKSKIRQKETGLTSSISSIM